MGERKVLNKYFPPDFDPAKLPRGSRAKDNMMKVRMMLPMSIRCKTCGTYMYKGTKFNTRKEDAAGETYLGIQVFRFYFRCNTCAAEVTMKTDPQNSDYIMEHGASRNYEPWREKDKTVAEAIKAREEEEAGNAMKALENRTLDSKREMDIMSALDEMRSLNARHERVDTEKALAALKRSAAAEGEEDEVDLDEEDEAALRALLAQQARFVRRLDEPGAGAGPSGRSQAAVLEGGDPGASANAGEERQANVQSAAAAPATAAKPAAKPVFRPKLKVLAKRKAEESADGEAAKRQQAGGPATATAPSSAQAPGVVNGGSSSNGHAGKPAEASAAVAAQDKEQPGLQGLLGAYGSGSDSGGSP